LLLHSARPSGPSGPRLRALTAQVVDWEPLVQAAAANDVLPLLYARLSEMCPDVVPARVLAELREISRQTGLRNLSLTHELLRLLALFDHQGIRAVPFKGPSLAVSLYGSLGLRRSGDLDILVRWADVSAAKRALLAEGYRLYPPMSAEEEAVHCQSEHHLQFDREDGFVRVEIHWTIVQKHLGPHADVAYVWDLVRPANLAGRSVLSLPPEDLFLILCIHGHKHDWDRLKWIADIGWMIHRHPDLDWRGILERAASLRQEAAVRLGCFLASSLLDVELPEEPRAALRADRSIGARAGLLVGRLFRLEGGLPGFREWLAYVESARRPSENGTKTALPRRFLQYLSAVLVPEARNGGLSAVSYLTRPFDVLRKHRAGVLRRIM
jgi:hypothetical protein